MQSTCHQLCFCWYKLRTQALLLVVHEGIWGRLTVPMLEHHTLRKGFLLLILTSRMFPPSDRRREESGPGGKWGRAGQTPQHLWPLQPYRLRLSIYAPRELGTNETAPQRTHGTLYWTAVPQSPAGEVWQELGRSQSLLVLWRPDAFF